LVEITRNGAESLSQPQAGRAAEVEGRCPTFIWGGVPDAQAYCLLFTGCRLSRRHPARRNWAGAGMTLQVDGVEVTTTDSELDADKLTSGTVPDGFESGNTTALSNTTP